MGKESIAMVIKEGKSLYITTPEEIGNAKLCIKNYKGNLHLCGDEALLYKLSMQASVSKSCINANINDSISLNDYNGSMVLVIKWGQALFITTPEEIGNARLCINNYQGYLYISGDDSLLQKLYGPTATNALNTDIDSRDSFVGSSLGSEGTVRIYNNRYNKNN